MRVVVADDHPIVRRGLCDLLDSLADVEVVAVAADGDAAIREVVTLRPDVILLDLQMPGVSGSDAIRELSRLAPSTAVLVLTMFNDDETVREAIRAGARGYLVKGAQQDEIERSLRAVADGQVIFGSDVADRVVGAVALPAAADPFPELSARETEILELVAAGLSNGVIGQRLGLATKTIANNVSAIFVKLGVSDRPAAIVRARDGGLGRH